VLFHRRWRKRRQHRTRSGARQPPEAPRDANPRVKRGSTISRPAISGNPGAVLAPSTATSQSPAALRQPRKGRRYQRQASCGPPVLMRCTWVPICGLIAPERNVRSRPVTRIAPATSASIGRTLPARSASNTARPRIYSRAGEHTVDYTVAGTRSPGTVSTPAPAGNRSRTPVSDGLMTCEFSALRLRLGTRVGWS
jgi:hypothetical protein